MRPLLPILTLLLCAVAAGAFNLTHLISATAGKRAAGTAGVQADICVFDAQAYDWARVSAFINVLGERVQLAADLIDLRPAPACGVASVVQSARTTMFAVTCVFANGTDSHEQQTAFFASLRDMFASASSPTGAGLSFEDNARFATAAVGAFVQPGAARHLDRLDTRAAAYDTRFHHHATGAGTLIYVIDTGITEAHHDFAPARAYGLANTVDDSGPADCNGHGTHVASLAAGHVFGVAKQARVRAIKALDCDGYGSVFSIGAALMLVQDACDAAPGELFVINLSVNGPGSPSIDNLIAALVARCHVAVVVAAGNSARDACLYSPSRASAAFAVGALDGTDAPASFTNYGACVKMAAPGVDVRAAFPYEANGQASVSATRVLSGTSMSAPLVAGAVALEMERMRACGWQNSSAATDNGGQRALAMLRQLATPAGSATRPPLLFVPPYTWCPSATTPLPPPPTQATPPVVHAPVTSHPPAAKPVHALSSSAEEPLVALMAELFAVVAAACLALC